MSLIALGVNHQTAALGIRERLSFLPADIPRAVQQVCHEKLAEEVVLFSTCNRTEIYLSEVERPEMLYQWLSDNRRVALSDIENNAYFHQNELASKHLFRVATGLDSMSLGEPQILGQIKAAYQTAIAEGGVKKTLNRLFQEAFYVAKNVRSDTKLGENSISIAYAAIKLSEQFYSNYKDLTALVIGAGQTGMLATKILHKKGIGKLLVANRTLSKAQKLAVSVGGYAMPLDQLEQHLYEADIIISATGRGYHTVSQSMIADQQKKRKQRMQVFLDLSVPRDIDPSIADVSNCYVFGVDNLQQIIDKNQDLRKQAARQAESLIDEYNKNFHEWLQLRKHHHLIKGVHDFAQNEKEKLTAQALKRLGAGESPEIVLDDLAVRLTKRLTHQPSLIIRQVSEKGQVDLLDTIKNLYNLD